VESRQSLSETTGVDLVVLCMAQCVQLKWNHLPIIKFHCKIEAFGDSLRLGSPPGGFSKN
jgi:hypothetical protein